MTLHWLPRRRNKHWLELRNKHALVQPDGVLCAAQPLRCRLKLRSLLWSGRRPVLTYSLMTHLLNTAKLLILVELLVVVFVAQPLRLNPVRREDR